MIIKSADKCYIENDQGIKLIDTTMGSGAQIIGHNNPLIKKIVVLRLLLNLHSHDY